MNYDDPNLTFVKDKRKRFELLDAGGWLDFASGAWDRDRNVRRAKCGRCTVPVAAGQSLQRFPLRRLPRRHALSVPRMRGPLRGRSSMQ